MIDLDQWVKARAERIRVLYEEDPDPMAWVNCANDAEKDFRSERGEDPPADLDRILRRAFARCRSEARIRRIQAMIAAAATPGERPPNEVGPRVPTLGDGDVGQ